MSHVAPITLCLSVCDCYSQHFPIAHISFLIKDNREWFRENNLKMVSICSKCSINYTLMVEGFKFIFKKLISISASALNGFVFWHTWFDLTFNAINIVLIINL